LVATQWPTLTDAQREQWEAFATTAYPRDKDGTGAGPNGQSVFNKLNWYRAVLGLSFLTSLPTGSLPAPLISVTTGEMGAEDELVFVVQHQARPGIDRLLIETTPPLPRGSLKPRDNDYRLVKGLNPTSFITVAAPGTEYRITEIRSPVPAGRRFGLRISVLTPEGMVSNPVSLVTTKIIV
ncbi:MAG: hypothetical protein SFY68_00505, partial [Candidatus Sumerlaeia bacterium]|nr:hypothetical protein [Candidatus Sumerlaeia bacterium]